MADKKRLKDRVGEELKRYESLKPELRAFIDEYEGLSGDRLYITSGLREAKKGQKLSKHHDGSALDIRTINTYNKEGISNGDGDAGIRAYIFLYNTPDGLKLLKKYNLGLIDETDPHTLKKTGGSGSHIHIGKDEYYAKHIDDRLNTFNTEHFNVILPYQSVFNGGERIVQEGVVQNMALNKGFDYSPKGNEKAVEAWYNPSYNRSGMDDEDDFMDNKYGFMDDDSEISKMSTENNYNYSTYETPKEAETFDYEEMARTVLALQREQEEPQRKALAIKAAEEKKQMDLEQRFSSVMSMFENEETTPSEDYVAMRRERQNGYEEEPLPFFEQEINPYLGQINIEND